MAFLNPSNQLIQIDTGSALTYLYNPTQGLGNITAYQGIGENQVLGQRYVGANYTTANPNGAPAIYILVQYLATSATTLAEWQTANAPAPVYWTDNTFTTVSGVFSEGNLVSGGNLNSVAGYWMPNYASLPNVTLAQLLGAYGLIQVAGPLLGAYGPTSGGGAGQNIYGSAGNFTSTGTASAVAGRQLGVQLTAVSSGLCNVLVTSDIF
jgi:hypothetical protein